MELKCELVHQDSRGELYQILLPTGQELMLLHSKAGSQRGGHSHTAPEVVALISGKLAYRKMLSGKLQEFIVGPGEVVHNIQPDEFHMGEFLEDSWLLEFKHGPRSAVGEWESIDYEPMRQLVRDSIG